MAKGATEIATAYVTVIPDTTRVAPLIYRAFGDMGDVGKKAGKSIGDDFAKGLGSKLDGKVTTSTVADAIGDELEKGGQKAGKKAGEKTADDMAESLTDELGRKIRPKTVSGPIKDDLEKGGQEAGKRGGKKAGEGFGDGFDEEIDKVAKQSKEKLSHAFSFGAIAGFAGAITTTAIGAIRGLAGEAIAASDATDKFKKTMQFSGADVATIDEMTAKTRKYADVTVYELADIQNMTAQLASNGVKDYANLAEAAGNLNAVAGGNADTFKSVGMVMTQTAGAGKLTTENWNQLSDAIPGAAGQLQKALQDAGAYTGNFRDAMAQGQITAEEFNDAVMKIGSEPVAVEAARSTETFEGMIGNLQATITGGLADAMSQLKPQIGGFINGFNGFVEHTVPLFVDGVKAISDVIGPLTGFFQRQKDIIVPLAITVGVLGGAYKVLAIQQAIMTAGGFVKWLMTIEKLTKAQTAAQLAWNVVTNANPIMLIATALIAVGAGLVYFFTKTETGRKAWAAFTEAVKTGWEAIKTAFKAGVDWVKDKIDTIKAAWQEVKAAFTGGDWGYGALDELFGGFGKTIADFAATSGEKLRGMWDGLKSGWQTAKDFVVSGFTTFQTAVQTAFTFIETIFNGFKDYVTNWWALVSSTWDTFTEVISTVFSTGWEIIKDIFATAWLVLVDIVTGNWDQIGNTIANGWNAIKTHFSDGYNTIMSTLREWFTTMLGLWNDTWVQIKTWVSTAWENIKLAFINSVISIKATMEDWKNSIIQKVLMMGVESKSHVNNFVESVKTFFTNMVTSVIATVTSFVTNTVAKFIEMKNRIITTVQELPSKIKSFFSNAGTWLVDAGRNIMKGLKDGLVEKWNDVWNWISGLKDKIASAFGSATASATAQVNVSRHAGGGVAGYARGGRLPTSGPGTHVTDGILGVTGQGMPIARVDAGEFIVNAKATKKFLPLLWAINNDALDPKRGDLGFPAFKDGGVVSYEDVIRWLKGQTVNGNSVPAPLEGFKYTWGGGLDSNWGDCSGTQSAVAALVAGVDTTGRKFSTATQGSWLAANGFKRGRSNGKNAFETAYYNGGSGGGHTAGTLFGPNGQSINVEMGGSRGNGQLGGGAAGSRNSQFTDIYWRPLASVGSSIDGITNTSVDGITVSSGGKESKVDWGEASSLASQWDQDSKKRARLDRLGLPFKVFDTGGVFRPNSGAINLSGKPEVIINNDQLSAINKLANNVGSLVHTLGSNLGAAAGNAGIKDWMGLAKQAGFGKIVEYIEPTVNAYEKLQDSLVVQQDAAVALKQAEDNVIKARKSGNAEELAAAEAGLTKARGVAVSAAKAAGIAQIELVITIAQSIGKVFTQIWEGQVKASTGVRKAMADSLKAVHEWTVLVDQQRATVSKLQQQVINDQIALTKSTWTVRLAQADLVRTQLEGVKSVAQAEAKLQAERDRMARKGARNWNDLSTAYDRYRHAERQGMVDRLGEFIKATPEILALEHEVNAAKMASLAKQYKAALAGLEASHAQQMATLNLAQSQLQLAQQSAQLAQMQRSYFGMGQAGALTGANTAMLYAEKAKVDGRANRGFLGWLGSFLTNPLGTLKYAFGGGARADREYSQFLSSEIQRRTAAGKGVSQTMDPALEAQVRKLFAMGLDEQAQNLIRSSALGAPQRALDEAKEDQMLLAMKQQEEMLKDAKKRLEALVEFEKKAQPLREKQAAFESAAAAHQYSADALREKNPAVRKATEALAAFEADNARNYAASARERTVINLSVPEQELYTKEQFDAVLKMVEKVPGIELRLDRIEKPRRPTASEVMAGTVL